MANESVTVTQTLDQVTVVSEGPVGLNAGGTISGALNVGADGNGHDVKFFGDGTGKYMQWDADTDKLFINGELEINGSATTFNSTVVTIDDPVFTLGGQEGSPLTGNDSKDRGIEFFYNDGAAKRGFMGYDDSADAFTFLTNASNSNEIFSGTAASLVTGAITAGGTLAMSGNQISGVTVLGGSGSNLQINAANGEHFLYGAQDGQVILYHNGVSKFQTGSVGVIVSGRAAIEQSQDDNGLQIAGFDDKSSETLKAYVKSTGDSRIDATRALRLFSGESYGGGIGSGTTSGVTWDAFNQFTFTAESSARIPLSIEGASGQSGDLFNITSNGGSAGDLLTVDSSGKVGIGVAAPSALLSVGSGGTARAGNTDFVISDSTPQIELRDASASGIISYSDSHGIQLFSNFAGSGSYQAILDTSGNLGIGVAAPTELLHVSSATSHKPVVVVENTNADSSGTFVRMFKNTASPAVNDSIGSLQYQSNNDQGSGRVYAQIAARIHDPVAATATGELKFNTFVNGTDTTVMTMLDGHVGIGTSSPSGNAAKTTLHIDGTSQGAAIRMSQSGNSSLIRYDNTAGLQIGTIASKPLTIETGDTAAITIDTSQNVGIGTSSPSTKLDVVGTKGSGGIITVTDEASVAAGVGGEIDFKGIYQGTTKTVFGSIEAKKTNATAGDYGAGLALSTRVNGGGSLTERLTILEGGNVGVGTTSPLGKLHVKSASAGSFTYDTNADDFIVESNSNGGMTIATAAANTGRIIFASPDDPTGAEISFSQTGNLMKVGPTTGSSDLVLQAASGTEFLRFDAGEDQAKASKHIRFNDDVQARFGTGTDATIRYTGSDWFIQCNLGDAYFQNLESGKDIILRANSGSGAEEYLRLDSSADLTTASKALRFQDNIEARFGSGSDIKIYHNGNTSNGNIENHTGSLYVSNYTDDGDIIFRSDDGSGGIATYLTIDGGREEVVASKPLIQTPGTVDPANNGELAFTVVSNTAIKIKYKGTDGVVRSTSLTLS